MTHRAVLPALLLAGGLAGCAGKEGEDGSGELRLEDVNPTSATFGDGVVVGEVGDVASAWYFTHAT